MLEQSGDWLKAGSSVSCGLWKAVNVLWLLIAASHGLVSPVAVKSEHRLGQVVQF